MLVNFRCSIKKNLGVTVVSENVLIWENLAEANKTDQIPGALAGNLLSKTDMFLVSLRNVLPWVLELCRKLQCSTRKDLTIKYFDDPCAKFLFDVDTSFESGGNYLKNLPILLDKSSHFRYWRRTSTKWKIRLDLGRVASWIKTLHSELEGSQFKPH